MHLVAQETLYENTHWKKLLHYKDNHHRVISKEFFLSGKENSTLEEELNATLEAFRALDGKKTVCRFPARYEWLKTKVNLPEYDLTQCEDLQKYYASFQKDEIDLVYSTGLNDSLAGYFGHTYLLFKNNDSSYDSAQYIDITAKIGNDNIFLYIYRGMVGVYNASYNKGMFYNEINYAIRTERYLSINKLELSKDEVKTLIYHLYELQDIKLIYYYLNGNCTSYLNDLLSLVKKSDYETCFIESPGEITRIYQPKISKTGSITLSDYNYPYPYDKFTTQEKKDYLNAIHEDENRQTVKEVKFDELHKPSELKLIDPSTISIGTYDRKKSSGLLASYIWYDKNVHDKYNGFEEKANLSLLKLELNVEKDKTRINHLYLADFDRHSFNEKVSIHIHSGLNRQNKYYDLNYENEFGLGIPTRYTDKFTSYVFLNAGLENFDPYVKPKVKVNYDFNVENALSLSHYHKLSSDGFHQTELEYTSKIGNFALVGKYIKNNGEEDNRVSLSVAYSF